MCLTPKITTHGNGIARLDTDHLTATNPSVDYDLTSLDKCSYLTMEEYNSLQVNANDLAILQLNIHGLINKQADLNKILMDGSINKVNVALLCETWLRTETTRFINIPSYSYVGKERKGNKKPEGFMQSCTLFKQVKSHISHFLMRSMGASILEKLSLILRNSLYVSNGKTLFNCYACYKTLFKYVMYVMKLPLIEKEAI